MKAIIKKLLNRFGYRKPDHHTYVVALSGAVLVYTPGGNVVLTPQAARFLARQLPKYAQSAEGAA